MSEDPLGPCREGELHLLTFASSPLHPCLLSLFPASSLLSFMPFPLLSPPSFSYHSSSFLLTLLFHSCPLSPSHFIGHSSSPHCFLLLLMPPLPLPLTTLLLWLRLLFPCLQSWHLDARNIATSSRSICFSSRGENGGGQCSFPLALSIPPASRLGNDGSF